MPVYQGGGEMIKEVSFEKTTYNDLPYKFEAGTPNIADTIAFKAALDFVTRHWQRKDPQDMKMNCWLMQPNSLNKYPVSRSLVERKKKSVLFHL